MAALLSQQLTKILVLRKKKGKNRISRTVKGQSNSYYFHPVLAEKNFAYFLQISKSHATERGCLLQYQRETPSEHIKAEMAI